MLTLSDSKLIPPGGWRFTVPQTGTSLVEADHARLFNAAVADLEEHGVLVGPDYLQMFNDELCRQVNVQCEVAAPATDATRTLTAGDILRFLGVMAAWMANGTLVSQEEADRRGEICAGCPLNVPVTGCSVCHGIAGKIAELTRGRRSRFASQLKGCRVCGCSNEAQINAPLDVLRKGPELVYPDWCWKKAP